MTEEPRHMDSRWAPGDVIVVQDVFEGRLWADRPVVVIPADAAPGSDEPA